LRRGGRRALSCCGAGHRATRRARGPREEPRRRSRGEHGRRRRAVRPPAVLLLRPLRPRLRGGRRGRLAPSDGRGLGRAEPEGRDRVRRRRRPPARVPALGRVGQGRRRDRSDRGRRAGRRDEATGAARVTESGELAGARGHLPVAVGDPAFGVGHPADGHALVADRDVGVVVLGLGQLGEPVDELDRRRERLERELPLERAVDLGPAFGDAHDGKYGRPWRKETPTRELLVELAYRPLAWLVVLAGLAAGIAAAVELARGDYLGAAALLVLKTVLDGADGMLARAAARVTALGRYLDSEADLAVNAALFAALGYATAQPLLAAAAFLVLTLVLSVNFNLR